MKTVITNADVYTDLQSLSELRVAARQDAKADKTLREVAGQFEAMFTQMMLKSMRAASPGEELFGSDQADFYRDMYDQQISILLSKGKGVGLAEMLVKQLGGTLNAEVADKAASKAFDLESFARRTINPPIEGPNAFVQALLPQAQVAAQRLGVPPQMLLAQAAHETGWGRSVIQDKAGRSSHNLFGIKADASWQGRRVMVSTLEYEDGVAVRRQEAFRAYDSYAESFQDYVNFLQDNPRYQEALGKTHSPKAFAEALQSAGYATDPAYARKLVAIFSGPSLRGALDALKNSDVQPINA